MAVLSTLLVRIDADIDGLTRGFTAAERAANSLAGRMESLGRGLTIGVTLPLGVLGAAAVNAAAEMDSLTRGLTAVAGSADKAAEQMDRLKEIAKLPVVNLREAARASIAFQAIGKEATFAERTIKAVANAVALSGGGAREFEGVLRQLRQVASLGRLMGEELNVILENAPALAGALQQAFGTTSAEAIRKLGLTTDQFFERFLTGAEALPQVSGGAANAIDNLGQALKNAAAAVGAQMLPMVIRLVEKISAFADSVTEADSEAIRWAISIAAVAAAGGPLLLMVGSLTTAVSTLATAIGVGLGRVILVGGPVLLGLSALAALFVKNKLDAYAAAGAVEAFKASLAGLSGVNLEGEKHALNSRIADLTRYREALDEASRKTRTVLTPPIIGRSGIVLRAPQQREVPRVSSTVASVGLAALDRQIAEARGKVAIIEELMKTAGNLTPGAPPIVPPSGTDKLAETLDRATAQVREFTFAARFGAATVAQLPETLQEAFQKTEQARERVDSLTEALARLGSRAPVGSARALVGLQADLAASEQALDQLAVKLEKGLARPNIPTLRVQDSTRFRADALNELRVMDTVVRKITQGVSAQELEWRKTHGALDGFLAVAEGLEHVLRGLEAVGEGASQTLSDIVELTRAAKQLRDAMRPSPETGLPNFGAALTGAVGVLGTALSIGSQLLGESASARELRLTLERNVQALDALRQEINGFRLSFDVQGGLASQIDAFLAGLPDIALRSPGAFDVNVDLERVLSRFGVSLDELRAAAERFGIEIFDSSGKLILGALNQLSEALRISALSVEKFAQTVEGQRKLLEARREIADITDPAVALADEFAFLLRGLSERAEIDFGLVGLDLSSAGGRAALDAALLKLIDSALAGTLDASMLAGFESVDEFIDHLLSTDRALDAFSQTANRAASSMVNVVEGFKIAQFRFDATREAAAVAPSGPVRPPVTPASGGAVTSISGLTIPITIQTTGDGRETYRQLYGEMNRLALANPQFRPVFALYPEPN